MPLGKPDTIKLRSPSCLIETNRPSVGILLAIGAIKITCQSKPAQQRQSDLRKAGAKPHWRPRWLSKPPACLNSSEATNRLRQPSLIVSGDLALSMRHFTSMFTRTKLEAASCGRTFVARSKRESTTPASGTEGAKLLIGFP